MELKIGDVVEFKKYEDMAENEILSIPKDRFPKSGKVKEVTALVDDVLFFFIEGSTCIFSSKSIASKKEGSDMELKVGDIVEFKNYEEIGKCDRWYLDEWDFPKLATVSEVYPDSFRIEETGFSYSYGTVKRVLPKMELHEGDEVLVKAHVINVKGKNLMVSWFEKEDVVKVLKHKPEKFIVQDDHYGMYVSSPSTLTNKKSMADIFHSRKEANEVAADLHLNSWEVIPYDD